MDDDIDDVIPDGVKAADGIVDREGKRRYRPATKREPIECPEIAKGDVVDYRAVVIEQEHARQTV